MIIISHRGYWKEAREKNTPVAFVRSFSLGFGTETDVRDYKGDLVISHDIADENSILFTDFLKIYKKYDVHGPLALNVKADGLQIKLKEYLAEYEVDNYFFFDMSIPDTLGYLSQGLKTFIRVSEYEQVSPLLLEKSDGIWLDGFTCDMVSKEMLEMALAKNKKICIVSADLHKRDHLAQWQNIKALGNTILNSPDIILCTDYPENAVEFFNGK